MDISHIILQYPQYSTAETAVSRLLFSCFMCYKENSSLPVHCRFYVAWRPVKMRTLWKGGKGGSGRPIVGKKIFIILNIVLENKVHSIYWQQLAIPTAFFEWPIKFYIKSWKWKAWLVPHLYKLVPSSVLKPVQEGHWQNQYWYQKKGTRCFFTLFITILCLPKLAKMSVGDLKPKFLLSKLFLISGYKV